MRKKLKKGLALLLSAAMVFGMMPVSASATETEPVDQIIVDETVNDEIAVAAETEEKERGTWGGIDWTLTADGTLTIAPTKGEPVPDKNAPTKRTYEVGEWREAVVYKSNGSASAIGGYPYEVKDVKTLIIEEGVTTIGSFTAQFPNLTGEVVIPSTVTYIGQEAFHKAPITKLTFAAGGTKELCIANGAFKKTQITEIAFPGDREEIHIHHWAFGGSPNLKTAYIPANVTKSWGGEHVDYFDNFNSQTNVSWTESGSIFTGCTAMQTITFENETIRDSFFAKGRQSTAEDYIVAYVGLTAYNTLDEALEAAQDGDTVGLVKNVTLEDTLTIPKDMDITLNLNGKTISQSKECTGSYEMINNKGNLTITGNGKISFTDTSAGDPTFGWGSYTIRNEGTLVVENGTIEHLGKQNTAGNVVHMYCAIFQYDGSTTINGGTISTPNYRSVRLWKGDMTINGGAFDGQVWVQAVDNTAKLAVNGGTFEPNGGDSSSVYVTNETYTANLAISGGTFNGKIGASNVNALAGCITGGTFNKDAVDGTNTALLAKGCEFEQNDDGTYGIKSVVAKVNGTTIETVEKLFEKLQETGDVEVELLQDVALGKKLTISGNVTILGGNPNARTSTSAKITRADNYTGTLFTVNPGATLTLDDGLVIDGGNNWTLNTELYNNALNNGATATWAELVTTEEDAPNATAAMFVVDGAVVANNVTIQNSYSSKESNGGDASIFKVIGADASLTMAGAQVKHVVTGGANSVAFLASGAKWTINGGTLISDTFAGRNGGVCRSDSGYIVMNGGEISNNRSVNTNGTVWMLYGGSFEMNGGKICSNSGIAGSDNSRCAAIYLHKSGKVIMNDGEICHNSGKGYGGIDVGSSSAELTINGGYVGENISSYADRNPSDVNVAAGKAEITGGTFTQDVAPWLSENTGLVYDGETFKAVEKAAGDAAYITSKGGYASLTEALAAAEAGDTIVLMKDVTASEIITIDKAITLNGKGFTLTSTAGRAINVSGADGVTIKNLTIKASGERAINIIQNATNVTIDKVTATAANYTVNLASSAANAIVTVTNSDLTGLNTVNIAAPGAEVVVEDSKITCNDQNAGESYKAIDVTKDAIGANVTVSDTEIVVMGDSVEASNQAKGAQLTVNGRVVEQKAVAYIQYGDYYNEYETLAQAIEAAKAGETIVLMKDVTASEIITIDKPITLNGKGFTLTSTAGRAINVDTTEEVTIKNVAIVGGNGCERGINIINKAGTTNLDNVTISGVSHYAAHIATSAGAATLNINKSNLTGYAAVAVYGAGSTVAVTDSDLTGVNNVKGYTNEFATIAYDAKNVTITVTGGKVTAQSNEGCEKQNILCQNANTSAGTKVTLNTELVLAEGNTSYLHKETTEATVTVKAEYADELVAEGYVVSEADADGMCTVKGRAVVKVGDVCYASIYDALDVIQPRETATITLLDDMTFTADQRMFSNYSIVLNAEYITLDLNGKTMTFDYEGSATTVYAAIALYNKATLTIKDSSEEQTGTIKNISPVQGNEGPRIIWVTSAGSVTIEAGNFISEQGDTMFYTSNSNPDIPTTLYIKGGYYEHVNPTSGETYRYFNQQNYKERQIIEVSGGTFKHDPIDSEMTVHPDYEIVENADGTFGAVKAKVAEVNGTTYSSLAEAIAAANAGDTVTVLKDITLTSTVVVAKGKEITLDLNGKTITGTDNNTTGNFYLFDNRGTLTIKDSSETEEKAGTGAITLEAKTNREWNASSVAVANNPGGKLIVENGTIKHLGGTDMAYAIDNLTNGKGTYAETIINGGTIVSPYRAIRQFLNGVEAQNILTINGGTIEGANKSVWMQDPSKNANTGKLTIGENAVVNGDVYLSVTEGSTDWPVTVTIAKKALEASESEVVTSNLPAGYIVAESGSNYVVKEQRGTWGGIDWTLSADGTLTIAPTKGEPVPDKNAPTKRTYEVGEWREAVIYKSNGSASAIGGYPYDVKAVKKLVIEEGVTKIGSFTVQFPNLTGEVVIPSTVTYIGQEAFHKAPITKLTFASGGTEGLCIANGAFKKIGITEIAFPGDREYIHIHHWVFGDCPNLTTAYIPANVTKSWGGEHVDYFDNFNSQTNVSWTEYGSIFTGCTKMQTITFENETIRDFFFAKGRQSTNEDYIVAYAGLVAYNSLNAAVEAAQSGETVKVLRNITQKETVKVAAGKEIILDLNGKTISQSKACDSSYEMINNKGKLKITGNGTISFEDTSAGDPSYGWGSYTIRNEGTLVVENGTIEHNGTQPEHMYCAIFQYSGSTTITGGTIATPNYRSVRLWKGDMTITGGTFDGQVWVQAVDNTSNLVIKGGEFAPNDGDSSSVFVTNSTYDAKLTVTGGTFNGKIGASDAAKLAGPITGGIFTATAKDGTDTTLLAKNYVFEANADGTYGVVEYKLAGEGTAESPFLIKTVEDLIFFRDSVNAGETVYNADGVHVALAADIDLAGIDWSVNIGDDCNYTFDGIFDGKGHTISNLTSEEKAAKSDEYICTGLFGAIGGNAVIKNLTIENVTIDTKDFAGNNAAAVVGFAYNHKGSIENVHVTGDILINAKNVYGVGAIVGYAYYGAPTIANCTVAGTDGSAINASAGAGAIVGYNSGKLTVDKCTVSNIAVTAQGLVGGLVGITTGGTVSDSTVSDVTLTTTKDAWKNSAAIAVGTINGPTTVSKVTGTNVNATVLVGSQYAEQPTTTVPSVEAKIGDVYYETLAHALKAEGDVVTVLSTVKIAAGETVTLDLNGKTVVGTPTTAAGYSVIENKGNLTITGEGSIVCDHKLAGSTAYAVNTITNAGTLVIDGPTIENKSTASNQIGYAIDNNSTTADAIVVVNDGNVVASGSGYYDGIRLFCNSTTKENSVTVNGGKVSSIWMQNPSSSNSKDVVGSVTITDGEVTGLYLEPSAAFDAEITAGAIGVVEFFETAENRDITKFISGGTFKVEVQEAWCAEGYEPVSYGGGVYGVKEIAPTPTPTPTPEPGTEVAKIGETPYYDVMKALAEAKDGETVVLVKDAEATYAVIPVGVTLDLAGFELTADYVACYGHIVDLSDDNTGLLKAEKEHILMQKGNKQLPVRDAVAGGYRFYKVIKFNQTTPTADGKYMFQPLIEATAHKDLGLGKASSGVSVKARVTLESANPTVVSQDFEYSDDFVKQFVASYKKSEEYGKAFTIVLKNASGFTKVTYYAVVVSELGVEVITEGR